MDTITTTIAHMDIYIYCLDHHLTAPDQGTPEWWRIFDIVRGDCTRKMMEDYLTQ